jgi:transketolase
MTNLKQKVSEIRRQILQSSYEAHACHIGSALSCVNIMVELFYRDLKDGDIFLFSKASGVATYYCILSDKGLFPKEKIAEYLHFYPLPSKEVPGVIHSCGSLGHGITVATGIAYANRDKQVYVLISDGECQEGTVYECAIFAKQHKLDNLHVIVDYNRIQAMGHTNDIVDLDDALFMLRNLFPDMRVAETIKGEGVDFMENDPSWHYKNLTPELLEQALCQI